MSGPSFNPARRRPNASVPDLLPVGSEVLLLGLRSKPELNGVVATVCGLPVAESGRYPVQLMDQRLLLKPENMELVENEADVAPYDLSDLLGSVAHPPVAAMEASQEPAENGTTEQPGPKMPELPPLPALPTSPMWAPLVDSGFSGRGGSGSQRGAVPIGDEDDDEDELYDEEEDVRDATMAADAALLDAAVAGASEGGGGFLPIDPEEWRREAGPLPPLGPGHRFHEELCGGLVRECDVRTEAGRAAATEAVTRRVPILMRGAGSVFLGKAAAEISSVTAVGSHLSGRDISSGHQSRKRSPRSLRSPRSAVALRSVLTVAHLAPLL